MDDVGHSVLSGKVKGSRSSRPGTKGDNKLCSLLYIRRLAVCAIGGGEGWGSIENSAPGRRSGVGTAVRGTCPVETLDP